MSDQPFPINATTLLELIRQTTKMFDDLYEERIGGSLLGDVFEIGEDDIFALNHLDEGLTKSGNQLAIRNDPTGGLTQTADGEKVKVKSGGGLATDADGLYISAAGGSAFATISCPAGTNPVADMVGDTLTLTGTGITITGNATTDTINFEATLSHAAVTVVDSDSIDFTLSTQQITAIVKDNFPIDHIAESTGGHGVAIDGVTLKDGGALVITGGTNTFNITNGTAILDIAASATLNIDKSLTVDGYGTTITGAGQANTLTLNEGFTIGDGYTGTLTYSAASKTLTVEPDSVVNQDLSSDAGPTFDHVHLTSLALTLTTLTMSDGGTIGQAAGPLLTFDDTNNYLEITGCNLGLGTATPRVLLDLLSTSQAQLRLSYTDDTTYTDFTVNSAGDLIIAPTSGNIQSDNYVSGLLGSGWRLGEDQAEFANAIIRGKLATTVFEKDTISIVNGILLVTKGDILAADMTALDASTLTIEGDCTFEDDEILRIKDGVDDEWLQVTDISAAPTYTVTRDLAGSYAADVNPIWKKGTAVSSMSSADKGFVELDGSSTYSPVITVHRRYGAAWNEYTPVLKIGKLDGFISIPADSYGIAIGSGSAYLKYYESLGLQIKGNIDASTITASTITSTDIIGGTFLTATTGQRFELDSDGMAMFMADDLEKWDGTGKWDGTSHYGPNIRAYLYNTGKNVPLYFNAVGLYGDIHYYNRVADPTGAAEVGDTCVTDGVPMICVGAGTPGTWEMAGLQTFDSATTTRTLVLRPTFNAGYQRNTTKPTEVKRGSTIGYSLPVYNSDDEEMFFRDIVPGRWDGTSNATFYIIGYLSAAEDVGDKFKLQVGVQATDGVTGTCGTSEVTATTETTIATDHSAQYSWYTVAVTIAAATLVDHREAIHWRVIRIAASSNEISGEFVVTNWYCKYVVDKMYS